MSITLVDPFELPDWLGTQLVTWRSMTPLEESARVRGSLGSPGQPSQDLDLLAVDSAYPAPVCPEAERRAAHQAWQFGEVLLLGVDGRVAAGVPVTFFDANLACETLRRVARSVGADTASFTVSIPCSS